MIPLLERLTTELNWPYINDEAALDAYLETPGIHCLLIPGDPARNLETADSAIVLPELRLVFQNAFDCALIGDDIEAALRQKYKVLKTPSFIFFAEARMLGAIARIRNWDDYMARIPHILSLAAI